MIGSWQNRPVTTLANTFFHTFKPFSFLNPNKYKPAHYRPPFRPLAGPTSQQNKPQMVITPMNSLAYPNNPEQSASHSQDPSGMSDFGVKTQTTSQDTSSVNHLTNSNLNLNHSLNFIPNQSSSDGQQYIPQSQQLTNNEVSTNPFNTNQQHDLLSVQTMITNPNLNNQSAYNLVDYNSNIPKVSVVNNTVNNSNTPNSNDINDIITTQQGGYFNNLHDHHVVSTANSNLRPLSHLQTSMTSNGQINHQDNTFNLDNTDSSQYTPSVLSSFENVSNSSMSMATSNFVRPQYPNSEQFDHNQKNSTAYIISTDTDTINQSKPSLNTLSSGVPYTNQEFNSYHTHQQQLHMNHQQHHNQQQQGFNLNNSPNLHETQSIFKKNISYYDDKLNNSKNPAINPAILSSTDNNLYQNNQFNSANNYTSAYDINSSIHSIPSSQQTGQAQTLSINNHDVAQLSQNQYITINNSPNSGNSNSFNNDTGGSLNSSPTNFLQLNNNNNNDNGNNNGDVMTMIGHTDSVYHQQQQQQHHINNNIDERYPTTTLGGVDNNSIFSFSSLPTTVGPTISSDFSHTTPSQSPATATTITTTTTIASHNNDNNQPIIIPGELNILNNEYITTMPTTVTTPTTQSNRLPSDVPNFNNNNKPVKEG